MLTYRVIAFVITAVSAAAMFYVGLYQSRFVGRLLPIFCRGLRRSCGCSLRAAVGIPDGYIGAVLYVVIAGLLLAPTQRWVWITLLALACLATLANIIGVRDMMNLGQFCFYCLTTTLLSPVLLWAVWQLR